MYMYMYMNIHIFAYILKDLTLLTRFASFKLDGDISAFACFYKEAEKSNKRRRSTRFLATYIPLT